MTSVESRLEPDDLRYFHDMTADEQTAEWQSAQGYLAGEAERAQGLTIYPNLEAVETGLAYGKLKWVEAQQYFFGIVAPIRDHYQLPSDENKGSLPVLHQHSADVLMHLSRDIKAFGSDDNQLVESFSRSGIIDWRISITSLLRTTVYQKNIAKQGRMAVGFDGRDSHSGHERGIAFDIDHGGLYVKKQNGQEVSINRDSNFDILSDVLPPYRQLLRKVIGLYEERGILTALEEVPHGWGCWHVAAIPEHQAA